VIVVTRYEDYIDNRNTAMYDLFRKYFEPELAVSLCIFIRDIATEEQLDSIYEEIRREQND
jgi:hypothetical protein